MLSLIKRSNLGLVLILMCILLSACGPSTEELAATSGAETASAEPISTPIPSSTPDPTYTPSPIPPTLTPTPIPPFRDDFTQLLNDEWEWLHETRFGWNLHEKPGYLRIEVEENDVNQVLLREALEVDFEV